MCDFIYNRSHAVNKLHTRDTLKIIQNYSSDKEVVKHIDSEDPGKLYYPTPEDFEMRLDNH